MLSIAFKEWAVICRALAEGRQSLILRKGGIAETGGEFRPEYDRFLLYPTYFHEQNRTGLQPELLQLFDAAEADRPPAGRIRFANYVEVASVRRVADLDRALALEGLHGWTAETVQKRFQYREPGLFVLTVRTYRLPAPVEVAERPEYAGCKTWVQLPEPVSLECAVPVLTDARFAEYQEEVADRLGV